LREWERVPVCDVRVRDAVFEHVIILLVPAKWRALKDQRGHGSGYVGRKLS
jgi:hypothetical protein